MINIKHIKKYKYYISFTIILILFMIILVISNSNNSKLNEFFSQNSSKYNLDNQIDKYKNNLDNKYINLSENNKNKIQYIEKQFLSKNISEKLKENDLYSKKYLNDSYVLNDNNSENLNNIIDYKNNIENIVNNDMENIKLRKFNNIIENIEKISTFHRGKLDNNKKHINFERLI